MTPVPALHGLTGPPGSRLRELLGDGLRPSAPLRPVTGCFERVVARVSGGGGAPGEVETVDELLARCRERGSASVAAVRADPSLVTELQLGGWFDATWRMR